MTVGRSECVFVDIKCDKSQYIRYGLVYRPPDTLLEESVELYKQYASVWTTRNYTYFLDILIYLISHGKI